MANTLTSLTTTIYNALDVVSRELVGFIPAITVDAQYTRAALNQTVMSPVTPAATISDITPGVTPPNDGDQTISNVQMTITKSKRAPIRWNGEERLALDNNGASYNVILSQQFQQAFRGLANLVEADLAALFVNASRATGTAGTTPYASDVSAAANLRKILADNGAPMSDLQQIIDTTAGAKLRANTQLTKANEAGIDVTLRRGTLLNLSGFDIRESAQIQTPAIGGGSAYTTTAAGFAVGTTSIPLITGSGTILAGDVITFAGDTNQYVVKTGISGPGTIVIGAPGLRTALSAATHAVSIVAQSTRNMGFARTAIALATRLPALPEQGDMAQDHMTVTDPVSGISFDVALYLQYRQIQFEVALAWGCAAIKPEHMALLLG